MKKFLSTRLYAPDLSLLLLRLSFGGLMAVNHGWGKLGKLTSGADIKFFDIGIGAEASLALAVLGELVCAALLAAGLFTRFAAAALVITMAVAVFGAHGDDVFGDGEHALMFLIGYLVILITGPGKYSADKGILKK
ncbi:MAG: DoxX family protein [Sphingobacteriales bacterium JAD_PAG50586_3]|nr:MAG: DoxX family protein [Sphingobacteriales bacterium JAD_PAG50586_3]